MVTQDKFNKAKRCLIEANEADIVLQALCYILTDEETEQIFDGNNITNQEVQE